MSSFVYSWRFLDPRYLYVMNVNSDVCSDFHLRRSWQCVILGKTLFRHRIERCVLRVLEIPSSTELQVARLEKERSSYLSEQQQPPICADCGPCWVSCNKSAVPNMLLPVCVHTDLLGNFVCLCSTYRWFAFCFIFTTVAIGTFLASRRQSTLCFCICGVEVHDLLVSA